jgi:hypothetical protein
MSACITLALNKITDLSFIYRFIIAAKVEVLIEFNNDYDHVSHRQP